MNGNKRPDVLLPYGRLFASDLSARDAAKTMKMTQLLPNLDLVVGPNLLTGAKEDKDTLARETSEFKQDMIYLKFAMMHGTVNLNELARKVDEAVEGKSK